MPKAIVKKARKFKVGDRASFNGTHGTVIGYATVEMEPTVSGGITYVGEEICLFSLDEFHRLAGVTSAISYIAVRAAQLSPIPV